MPSPLLVGLSGPSSSGKTTIARHLRNLLPQRVLILHEDDFYRPEAELPKRAGHLDWDCAGAIDIPALITALSYIKQHGEMPPDLDSKEDRNDVGPNPVDDATIAALRKDVQDRLTHMKSDIDPIVVIDGFLLFGESVPEIRKAFDLRLMLRATYQDAKARRERRSGYVTLEGFWEDPPGYVDEVVWPGYVEEHAYLFKEGNVEGEVDEAKAEEVDVRVAPGKGESAMKTTLEWVVKQVKGALAG